MVENISLWVYFNVRLGFAQRTVTGLVYNDLFKMDLHEVR